MCDTIGYLDGKIDADALDKYVARIIKSGNRYVWLLSLADRVVPQQAQPERGTLSLTTYKSGVVYQEDQQTDPKRRKAV